MSKSKYAAVCVAIIFASLSAVVAAGYLAPYTVVAVPSACKASPGPTTLVTSSRIHFDLWSKTRTVIALRPALPNYEIPGVGKGVLLTNDSSTAVAAELSGAPSFGGTLYFVDLGKEKVVASMVFPQDPLLAVISRGVVAAALNRGVAYVYFSGLGYEFNTTTGALVGNTVKWDNYREVYSSGGEAYVQIDAYVFDASSGRGLAYHPNLAFSGVAYGCLLP